MDRTPMLFVRLAAWVDDDDHDLPRRGYGYRPGMTEQELKDSTRAWWALSAGRAARYRYAAAVADGYVVGVFGVVDGSWRSIDGRRLGKSPKRWAFDGEDAPEGIRAADRGAASTGPSQRRPSLRLGLSHRLLARIAVETVIADWEGTLGK